MGSYLTKDGSYLTKDGSILEEPNIEESIVEEPGILPPIREFITKEEFEENIIDNLYCMFRIENTSLYNTFLRLYAGRYNNVNNNINRLMYSDIIILISSFFNTEEDGGKREAKRIFYEIFCNTDGLLSCEENIIVGRINRYMMLQEERNEKDNMVVDVSNFNRGNFDEEVQIGDGQIAIQNIIEETK